MDHFTGYFTTLDAAKKSWAPELGKPSHKKICLYLDIIKIALTPLPVFLETYEALFLKPKKLREKNVYNVQIKAEKCLKSVWIGVTPLPPLENVQIQAEKRSSNNLDSGRTPLHLWTKSKYEQIVSGLASLSHCIYVSVCTLCPSSTHDL